MTWKTIVVWDISNQAKMDMAKQLADSLMERYADNFNGKTVEPVQVKTVSEELKQVKSERFWVNEATAQFYLDNVIQYLISQELTPVSYSAEPVTE